MYVSIKAIGVSQLITMDYVSIMAIGVSQLPGLGSLRILILKPNFNLFLFS